jgi:hypothetical protein
MVRRWSWTLVIAICLVLLIAATAQTHDSPSIPLATSDRLEDPGWWPTKGTGLRDAYVGEQTCSGCHAAEVSLQRQTPMAHAASRGDAEALSLDAGLTFHNGPYLYRVARGTGGCTYSVSNDDGALTTPLGWVFGAGVVGQTYVLSQDGKLYESQVSYYPGLKGLDFTTGHKRDPQADLQRALGEPLNSVATAKCFGCHTTAASTKPQPDLEGLVPGVHCEACHGPGASHVAAMKEGQIDRGLKAILNPAHLNPVDSVDFCGACHRAPMDVVTERLYNRSDIRFQPYRLEKSRCWGQRGDDRMTCIACHDPHKPLEHDASAYDDRCLSCHRSKADSKPVDLKLRPGAACPVSTHDCASCHMPKYPVPEMHAKFTDHYIRVVKDKEAYPY